MKLKLDCQEVSKLLSERQDKELPASEVARLRVHMVMCDACRNVNEQFDFIRRAMRRIADEDGKDS